MYENIRVPPPPKRTDGPKMIFFCLAPLIKVRANCYYFGLIRHMFPNYNRLFDPNCKSIFSNINGF